jgi:hypothetical protein
MRICQEMPKGLPPSREHENQIDLILVSTSNIRPYGYPFEQKSEIEKMVLDMLDARIIRPNRSAFSTLAVMVRRKDNSWRMCHDYKDLKKINLKDKFPIPIVDDLLEELHG